MFHWYWRNWLGSFQNLQWKKHCVSWVPNFDLLHIPINDLEWQLCTCELDLAMQGHHLLPKFIMSSLYHCLDRLRHSKAVGLQGPRLMVQTCSNIFQWLYGSNQAGGCLLMVGWYAYQVFSTRINFVTHWPSCQIHIYDMILWYVTKKQTCIKHVLCFWGLNFFIGCWRRAHSQQFHLLMALWWPCCRTFVSCNATWQNGSGIEVSTKNKYLIKSFFPEHIHTHVWN